MFRLFGRLLVLGLFLGLAVVGWMTWFTFTPLEIKNGSVDFSVKPGSSLRTAARQIKDAGVNLNLMQFDLLSRLLGRSSTIKAGNYQLNKGTSPFDLLQQLSRGKVNLTEIAFIEGWTFKQIRKQLSESSSVKHDSTNLNDNELMQRIGAIEQSPEGLFFPDTYLFDNGTSDLQILKRAYKAMKKQLAAAWESRDLSTPYGTPYEALIMASIVEKETGHKNDRDMVAAVFVNRLKLGMMLQADPTVIYGMGDQFDGNLRKRDLQTDTAFNTYTRTGLPPTPIAMPGLASLHSALNPAKSKALYFVARGDGTSHFSNTLKEHNRAVVKYQLGGNR